VDELTGKVQKKKKDGRAGKNRISLRERKGKESTCGYLGPEERGTRKGC